MDRERDRDRDRDRLSDPKPIGKSLFGAINAATLAILAAVFVLGVGIGITFSSTANFDPASVASREVIDRSAPNAEFCVQYGASAISVDIRAFLTLSPFNVYLAQPTMKPGCVLRSSNWGVLQSRNLITGQEANECKNRLNTFGFTGDLESAEDKAKIDCVYQNSSAGNFFLNQTGINGGGNPQETNRF